MYNISKNKITCILVALIELIIYINKASRLCAPNEADYICPAEACKYSFSKEYIILIIIKQIATTKELCNNKNAYDAKSICDNYNI